MITDWLLNELLVVSVRGPGGQLDPRNEEANNRWSENALICGNLVVGFMLQGIHCDADSQRLNWCHCESHKQERNVCVFVDMILFAKKSILLEF